MIHADLPNDAQTLLHRSGRTGRAGRKGICAVLVTTTKKRSADRLIRSAKVDLSWKSPPGDAAIQALDRQRVLASPHLQESLTPDEESFAINLLEAYHPKQIAAAFWRLSQSALPAPEELSDLTGAKSKRPSDFDGGVWFSINTGRKDKAEPRWLLPVICRSGNVKRKAVGSISIGEAETRFEIDPVHAEAYREVLSKRGCVEPALTITYLGEKAAPEDSKSVSDAPKNRKERKETTSPRQRSRPKRDMSKPKRTGPPRTKAAKRKLRHKKK